MRAAHPEVLAPDWVPPTVIGRESNLGEVLRHVDAWAAEGTAGGRGVALLGPAGSGTSTFARVLARRAVEAVRRRSETGPLRSIVLDTRGAAGAHAIAAELLRSLDEGFRGTGFSVAEILAGFLRRLRRERRPLVAVLDNLGR